MTICLYDKQAGVMKTKQRIDRVEFPVMACHFLKTIIEEDAGVEKNKIGAQIIQTRLSVREYLPDMLTEDELKEILEAGRRAPSGENAQPWAFVVVKSEETRRVLGQLCQRGSGRRFTGEYVTKKMQKRFEDLTDLEKRRRIFEKLTTGSVSAFVAKAPVLIVVIGLKNVWDMPYDCSAAIENMLLMAHAMDLGGCWVNASTLDIRDEILIKGVLAIPEDYKVMSIMTLGRPVAERKPRIRRPLSTMVFREKYGVKYYEGGEN